MKITADEVRRIAHLSRFAIADSEMDSFVRQFNDILVYVDKLNELDTENVEPTTQVSGDGNAMREDVVKPSLTQEQVLANAPEKADGGYLVPRVMEGGGA